MRWFVEERTFSGGWTPAIYHGDKPTEKRTGGHRVKFREDPQKMPDYFDHLTLREAAEVYGVDGKFRATVR